MSGRLAISRAASSRIPTKLLSTRIMRKSSRRDRSLTTTLEVIVSSEDDAEIRRVSITNSGMRPREIQVTSYAELCLDIRRPPTRRIPLSQICLSRRNLLPMSERCSPRAASDPTKKRPFGRRTCSSWKVKPSATCNTKPTARDSSGAPAISATPSRSSTARPLSEHGRLGARSGHEPAPHRPHSAGTHGARRFFHHRGLHARGSAEPRRQVSRTRERSSAR